MPSHYRCTAGYTENESEDLRNALYATSSRNKGLSRTTENDLLEIKESPGIPSYEVYS